MAHQIEIVNGVSKMAFFGKLPWHVGQEMTEADLYDWPSACTKSGLAGWELTKVQFALRMKFLWKRSMA